LRKKTKTIILLSCVLVLVVGMGVAVFLHRVPPPPGVVWEQAPNRANQRGVTLTFSGMDIDDEADLVVLHCVLTNDNDLNIGNGFDVAVDYLMDGEWFTTYDSTKIVGVEPLPMVIREAGTREVNFTIPKDAFKHIGIYRLSVIEVGMCEFDVLFEL
jgi:hypothetical protein